MSLFSGMSADKSADASADALCIIIFFECRKNWKVEFCGCFKEYAGVKKYLFPLHHISMFRGYFRGVCSKMLTLLVQGRGVWDTSEGRVGRA